MASLLGEENSIYIFKSKGYTLSFEFSHVYQVSAVNYLALLLDVSLLLSSLLLKISFKYFSNKVNFTINICKIPYMYPGNFSLVNLKAQYLNLF